MQATYHDTGQTQVLQDPAVVESAICPVLVDRVLFYVEDRGPVFEQWMLTQRAIA